MSSLRNAALEIAADLPVGDPVRREILSAVQEQRVQQVLDSLDLLSHHKIKPKVERSGDFVQISFVAPTSMAAAYVENHLNEQLGSRASFDVEGGGKYVYIDLT